MVQGPRPAEVPGCDSLPLDQGLPGDARGVDSCQDQGGGPQLLLPQGTEEADYEPEEIGIVEFQGINTPVQV